MTKVITVTNQKGGVGKTTTSINLAAALAREGKRVMLIDIDPQGNATTGSGRAKGDVGLSVYQVLIGTATIPEARVTMEAGYDLVPANADLAGAQVELLNEIGRELRLRLALNAIRDQYDYIFVDCPPSLNVLTVNALTAADAVIIPMQCEYFALEGLSDLVNTIRKIRETLNPRLKIEGLVRTMFDGRNTLANEVSAQLCEHFGEKVYNTIIPRNVRLAEAPSYGKPAIMYDVTSKGAEAYIALAGEILQREQTPQAA